MNIMICVCFYHRHSYIAKREWQITIDYIAGQTFFGLQLFYILYIFISHPANSSELPFNFVVEGNSWRLFGLVLE